MLGWNSGLWVSNLHSCLLRIGKGLADETINASGSYYFEFDSEVHTRKMIYAITSTVCTLVLVSVSTSTKALGQRYFLL